MPTIAPAYPIGLAVLLHDSSRPPAHVLRRAVILGPSSRSGLWDLLVYALPPWESGADPVYAARDIELLESEKDLTSPIKRACWPEQAEHLREEPPPAPRGLTKAPDRVGPGGSQGLEGDAGSTPAEAPAAVREADLAEVRKGQDGIVRIWSAGGRYFAGAEKGRNRMYLNGNVWVREWPLASSFASELEAMDALEAAPRPVIDVLPSKKKTEPAR